MGLEAQVSDPTAGVCTCPSLPASQSADLNLFYSDVNQCVLTVPVPAPPKAKPINNGNPHCTICKGDPINVGTGNSFQTQTDVMVSQPLSGLSINRTYNSSATNPVSTVPSSFGARWTQPYEA
eukprot:gene5974-7620_t